MDGVTYTVGVDAFASATDAATVLGANGTDKVTEITVGDGDHIYDIASDFVNVQKITVPAGMTVEDDAVAQFKGDIEIVNAVRQDKESVESTGIGLKTCERIAKNTGMLFEKHDGGDSFRVTLGIPKAQGAEQ